MAAGAKSRTSQGHTSASQGPFSKLDKLLKDAGIHVAAPQTDLAPKPAPPTQPLKQQEVVSDEELFAQAMEDVRRASWRHNPPEAPPLQVPIPSHDAASEERRLMEAAVDGNPALTVLDHPEYIEGWIGVAGKRFLPNLRNGLYSIQGQIDLHGSTQEEARRKVEEFIDQMSRFRSCCVKIIHGRGINSPNDRAVLKESLQRWLSTRRMSRH
ncbi:MAG TPA: Smr/MutS family protein, partial [Acidobacteriota bacterium]|nr:Smr/MutS family protein [Acidobacteriota bacterium]